MPIPGTNYSAFQVARGRQPSTIGELRGLVSRGAAYSSLHSQVQKLAEQMNGDGAIIGDRCRPIGDKKNVVGGSSSTKGGSHASAQKKTAVHKTSAKH